MLVISVLGTTVVVVVVVVEEGGAGGVLTEAPCTPNVLYRVPSAAGVVAGRES